MPTMAFYDFAGYGWLVVNLLVVSDWF